MIPPPCCNGKGSHIECCRFWVRHLGGSYKIGICCFTAKISGIKELEKRIFG